MMEVHHRLSRPRADHTRQRPASEVHHIFTRPRRYENRITFDMMDFILDHDGNFFFRK